MTGIDIEPWEPEETVGKLWHRWASRLDAPQVHDGARVDLAQVGGRLATLFRGLGGDASVEIKPVGHETSQHRLSLRRRLGTGADEVPRASFDGAALRLPESLGVFPARETNAALYLWLAAMAAQARPGRVPPADPLQADLAALATARETVARALEAAPGFTALYRDLCAATLGARRVPALPPQEAALETVIRHMLGGPAPLSDRATAMWRAVRTGDVSGFRAARKYRPFRPVALWPEQREIHLSEAHAVEDGAVPGGRQDGEEGKAHRARRRKSDQAERNDSFILHKYEAILSWAEFLNLNRRVDDDDDDNAAKAADDHEEIGLGQISKAPATRLKLHLDLAPEDAEREALSAEFTYPEWDVRSGSYLPDHTRVLASFADRGPDIPSFRDDPRAMARIRAVRKQFEALRPGRVLTSGHRDGDELDMERALRARVDFHATGETTDRVWRQARPEQRDLAVSILLDTSRSTEAAVPGHGHDGRAVIDVEREALAALAWGLDACGDAFAIHAFSSLRRSRVFVQEAKGFDEPMSRAVESRIGGLHPGFYTRLGAAVRHCSRGLSAQARKRRLLLVITDGKPNDLDHYEGRHGIEDSHKAVLEARRAGHSVFGITIDRGARAWFPRIFGQNGFAVIANPDRLTQALPQIYRELTGA
ncbi:MAG: nitric oxide reductase D protein [Paracoccaceae bacterium]